jgi:hypothetical protein
VVRRAETGVEGGKEKNQEDQAVFATVVGEGELGYASRQLNVSLVCKVRWRGTPVGTRRTCISIKLPQ